MAKTQTITTPDELRIPQRKALEQRDRFILGAIQAHKSIPSKQRKKAIREMSLFGFLAQFWRNLTPAEKNAWRSAGNYSNLTNWQLFISDNAARIRHDLPLDKPPSDLWQVRAGRITLKAPADKILLKQEHPQEYWIAEKVTGAPWKNELVKLEEIFSFPLTIGIRYKASLTANGATQVARYKATVWTSYQGQDIEHEYSIDFSPTQDWKFEELQINQPRGIIIGYTLWLEIRGYRGTLEFDNIRATHGGTNWARDPRCDAIDKKFKKAFAVVPPFWLAEELPEGASYTSTYPLS